MKSPSIECYEHHATAEIAIESLSKRVIDALPQCLDARGAAEPPVLGDLEEIEVSLISDEEIARVHGEFMDDPTPTDVITFHHGEILVSAETAARCAAENGHSPEREALLYVIHGLLHLNGHTDLAEPDRAEMHATQERILESVWPWRAAENRE